jgi:hypothetical protein
MNKSAMSSVSELTSCARSYRRLGDPRRMASQSRSSWSQARSQRETAQSRPGSASDQMRTKLETDSVSKHRMESVPIPRQRSAPRLVRSANRRGAPCGRITNRAALPRDLARFGQPSVHRATSSLPGPRPWAGERKMLSTLSIYSHCIESAYAALPACLRRRAVCAECHCLE